MSYIFLRERGEVSSADSFSGIPQFVPSRLTRIASMSCCSGNVTESCPGSRSGTTCKPSTANPGEGSLMSFVEDFPARTSVLPGKGPGSPEHDQDYGPKWPASLAKYDLASRFWRTRQRSLLGGFVEFSGTWPAWGTTVAGELYLQPTPSGLEDLRRSITYESASGFSERVPTPGASKASNDLQLKCSGDGRKKPNKLGWYVAATLRFPTPTVKGNHNRKGLSAKSGDGLATAVYSTLRFPMPTATAGRPIGGSLNPMWVEWLMGWPIGWTDLSPLEMDRFQQWLHSHGGCYYREFPGGDL